MRDGEHRELPESLRPVLARAVRLEWLSLAYLATAVAVTASVMGPSQAMRTVWLEDALGLLSPAAFLVAARLRRREANARFPYGYHRAVSVAFLMASAALLVLGAWLLVDALLVLARAERPTLGTVVLGGRPVWRGWLMFPALAWGAGPPVLLGRAKVGLARQLHDKVLYADAETNKADWQTALAGAAGVLGIAAGWWWADAAAGGVISLGVLYDGWVNARAVLSDLMDRTPYAVDHGGIDPVSERLRAALAALPWVRAVDLRLRESGHVFFGEAFVVPGDERDPLARVAEARAVARGLDWRIQEVAVVLVRSLEAPHGPAA